MPEDNSYNIFHMAQKQFDRTADWLGLDQATRDFLRLPMREYQFSLPVYMDDGETQVFRGFCVQYNDACGPTKGGVRFHPNETIDTIRALAMWMTWKCAVTELPLGGSSSGVACDPHGLSPKEQERLSRAFVRQIAYYGGSDWDVLGPDIMTGPQHMLWMLDEYETLRRRKSPGFITGKPINHAGSKGRKEAPGYGVIIAVREALRDLGLKIEDTSLSIQGFGTVGQHACKLYQQMGGKLTTIACWHQADATPYAYRKKDGIPLEQVLSITNAFGEIDKSKAIEMGLECLPGEKWIEQDVDILIPAALENQVRADNADAVSSKVRILAEAANGPTNPDVDPLLEKRGIHIIPDVLANAGGVVSSYFEQVQSNMNYYWSKDEVFGKLDTLLTAAYRDVNRFAKENDLPMRDAVSVVAVDRVARACQERGWV